ncbi:uncharacterized protein KD926_004436 [Aspergillus affinis]|uniref:uncharacterized protein n=1 Tax=Aspergillus affinis TaxID=1070780 RepID=UPI0022FE5095|nr:uncharacterized protein KD926_004436 [Aspergillus affinis]KAI9043252.1 hypothetical protein KD926_004436 [Aspergillus affinis]
MVQITPLVLAGMAIFGSAFARPSHDIKAEAAERAAFMKRTPVEKRSLGHCADTLKARPSLKWRSFESALNTSHHSNMEGITQYHNPEDLFKAESTCVLADDITEGPYSSTNGNDSDANLDTTSLRGIHKSDENGVVTFESIFPGHYTGRATHIHDNTQELTTNAKDDILEGEAEDIDLFMEYVLLGDDVSDGIFAWISVAIDPTSDRELSPAAYFTHDGGVENENSDMGGGPGGASHSGPPSASAAPSS